MKIFHLSFNEYFANNNFIRDSEVIVDRLDRQGAMDDAAERAETANEAWQEVWDRKANLGPWVPSAYPERRGTEVDSETPAKRDSPVMMEFRAKKVLRDSPVHLVNW